MRYRWRRAGADRGAASARGGAPGPDGGADRSLTLADLRPGECASIVAVGGSAAIRARLRDLGFIEGECVRMVKTAPLADPAEYCVQGIDVGLRRSEAELIQVRDVFGGVCRRRRGRHHRWGRRGLGPGGDEP